jgi:hypothetical protein
MNRRFETEIQPFMLYGESDSTMWIAILVFEHPLKIMLA